MFFVLFVEFKRPADPSNDETEQIPSKKRNIGLGSLISESIKQNNFFMGNTELTRLWNLCPDNLQACRGADRNFLPSIDVYLENPKDKIDPSFEWRALRLLARQSPHFFTLIQTPNKVSDYLEGVRKKIQESKTKKNGPEVVVSAKPEIENVLEKDDGLIVVQDEREMLKTEQFSSNAKTYYKVVLTKEQLDILSVIVGGGWKKLGTKLGKPV